MPSLPVISGQQAISTFSKDGWIFVSQKGSHIKMTKEGSSVKLIIPNHKTLDRATLRSLIRKSGLTVDEFIKLL
ncbi:type II toxin-antitoxin system HicA family toxin [Syntrophomonas wolfei]|jgi:predicted RNA binding protein YcfA (HicA-like mRNA interferase family)|uniref:Type II toxin-antitoxin system HicA family toxin n=1 Tax=Syntrophomonas wolfei TaxID=863 RepID=A0A354YWH3_9FIRM|nr:type II toxin-antitoxin system HicA family toxin [Syntrophomonas wolfei]HBK53693.1 type II toxin-antitoxin system HicA family toxin [Syntrophomonas wolfei]